MSLILSGTDGLSDVDGTAATPAIRGTDANTGIFFPAADTIAFAEGGVESMRIDSSGNLGIGTATPVAKLNVKTLDATNAAMIAGTTIGARFSSDSSGVYIDGTDPTGSASYQPLFTGGSVWGVRIAGTERMRIDSSGNVGIATSSPRVRLDVRSDAVIAAPTPLANAVASGVLAIGDSVGSVVGLQLNGSSYDTYFQARNMGAASTAYNLLLQPLGGNVGIGTSSPVDKLDVRGGAIRLGDDSVLAWGASGYANYISGNLSTNSVRILTNSVERMRIDSSGNVGIGITAITGKLHVLAGSVAEFLVGYNGTSFNYYDADNQIFRSAGKTERMRIDSSGNLNVGGTTSGVRLYVKGSTADTSSYPIYVQNSSGTDMFHIRADGRFVTGTGTASPYNSTTGGGANMVVNSDGAVQRSTSSLKYKQNVQDASYGLADVMKLRPVTYESKNENEAGIVYGGLIAEEVQEAGLTQFVQYADDGTPDALSYGNMVSLCIKAIQEQQALITALTTRITALETK